MSTVRLFARVLALMVVLTLLAGAVWLWQARVDPATISQSRLHDMGTQSDTVTMSPLPSQHRVVIEAVRVSDMGAAARSVVPAWLGGMPDAAVQGYFDSATGRIYITGAISRLQASLPVPWLQGQFRHNLRHEYGHAFLDEWLRSEAGDEAAARDVPFIRRRGGTEVEDVPEPLRPVVREYLRTEERTYGSTYFTSSFTEYLAESYARFLEGEPVPPKVGRFLESASRGPVATR